MNPRTSQHIRRRLATASFAAIVGPRPWRARVVAGLMAVGVVMGAATPAAAQAAPAAPYVAPFVELGALDSQPGEGKETFVLRAGQAMAQQAQGRREVCGMLMVNLKGNAWRVRLISNAEHMGCVALRFREPGFVSSGETIHTHAVDGRMTLDEAQQLPEAEFAHGPGYIVAGGSVFALPHRLATVERVGYYNLAGPPQPLVGGGYLGPAQILEPVQSGLKARLQQRRGPTSGNPAPSTGQL